jgi:SAM-dependent methyltransferase
MALLRALKWMANLVMKPWYTIVNRADTDGVLHFMNYGFQGDLSVALEDADAGERYPIQLYHHTASAVDLNGRSLLEVGCGRGGGLSYVHRYLGPRASTGVDLNPDAIEFCSGAYPELSFRVMDAQNLDFPDDSFDAVLNVESSHRYPDFSRFAAEVFRVLKPGGHFLFTDFRYAKYMPLLEQQLEDAGFVTLRSETINEQVLRALSDDADRRIALIRQYLPRLFSGAGREFAGTPGTGLYRSFEHKRRIYTCKTLMKPESANGQEKSNER